LKYTGTLVKHKIYEYNDIQGGSIKTHLIRVSNLSTRTYSTLYQDQTERL